MSGNCYIIFESKGILAPLSPVFTVVYRQSLLGGRITPVLGAGAVVVLGADVQVANPLLERYLNLDFEVAPTLGAIAQAGSISDRYPPVAPSAGADRCEVHFSICRGLGQTHSVQDRPADCG